MSSDDIRKDSDYGSAEEQIEKANIMNNVSARSALFLTPLSLWVIN